MKILVLNQEDMQKVISMKEVIEADKQALQMYSKGNSQIPLRTNLSVDSHEGQSLYMPGYAKEADALGIKIVAVYPKNIDKGIPSVPSTMILQNEQTGEVNCLMDGTYLTKLRTGAVAGAATDLLANPDSEVFLLIGTGGQAVTQLEAVLEVRPIKTVYVCDINEQRANEFAKEMQELFSKKYNVEIKSTVNANEIVPNADIITAVTTSKRPVFSAENLKSGVHINGVGSYTPEMQEIPEEVLTKASVVFVDTRDGVLQESGDLLTPIKNGTFSEDKVTGELGELVDKKVSGRKSKDDITFFKTTGSAILDIVVAKKIYENASSKNIGKEIDL